MALPVAACHCRPGTTDQYHTLLMEDSWGDGWNDAFLFVTDCEDRQLTGPITLPDGYHRTVRLCADLLPAGTRLGPCIAWLDRYARSHA